MSLTSPAAITYREYLASPRWQQRRLAVLKRCGHTCEARLDGCTLTATQVHHLRYPATWGEEPLWDLAGVCRSCHRRITDGMDSDKKEGEA